MRTRSFAVAVAASLALFAIPLALNAQIGRLPRPGSRGTVPPTGSAPPTPEAPVVAHAMELIQSRWSAESYSFLNSIQLPTSRGTSTLQTFGAGVHGGYRFTDNFAVTMDGTTANVGQPSNTASFELGTRYSPFPWQRNIRPFMDVRGAYMRMYDTFPITPGQAIASTDYTAISRYGTGLGGGAGAGLEISLTRSFALTTEVVALRSKMTSFESSAPTIIPNGTNYWATTARYVVGLRYAPVRTAHLKQNPTS